MVRRNVHDDKDEVGMTPEEFQELTGAKLEEFRHQCHGASLEVVKGLWKQDVFARVARGSVLGVPGQHSWVVLGTDCYDPEVTVLDPTSWSYMDEEPHVWSGRASEREYHPHGTGSIFQYGQPIWHGGPTIKLANHDSLSPASRAFLKMIEPLDARGWMTLFNAPVQDWPAAEIIAAADDTPSLSALIPIDILGMLTMRNPDGLYMAKEAVA